jgi:DNA-binding response OmpR family regulator
LNAANAEENAKISLGLPSTRPFRGIKVLCSLIQPRKVFQKEPARHFFSWPNARKHRHSSSNVRMSKILLVDDDAFIVEAYSSKLIQGGFKVETAIGGAEAREVLVKAKPELVVLDLMLPQFNGFELINYIRSCSELKATRTIVLSNFYLGDSEREAAASLADATLAKSECTPGILLATINQLLQAGTVARSPDTAKAAVPETDVEAQQRHRGQFLKNAHTTLATLRQLNESFIHSDSPGIRGLRLLNFYRKVHFLSALAGLAGYTSIAMLASAFESLLMELHEKQDLITPSTLQTIAYTLDFFRLLFAEAEMPSAVAPAASKALVVDDDRVSSQALVNTLSRANLDAIAVHDPLLALKRLEQEDFALILLDIQMPELDGFAFCKKVRQWPQYSRTPIIFVTGQDDFESRIHSVLSGGNDLIAKPVFPIELLVKVVTHLLRSRLPAGWSLT